MLKETFFCRGEKAWGERTSLLILMGILFVVDMNMRMRIENGTESSRKEGRKEEDVECR